MSNKSPSGEDLVSAIHAIMSGEKSSDPAKHSVDAANKKVEAMKNNQLHKAYDIAGDKNPEKPVQPEKSELPDEEEDLEYVKKKMGMDSQETVYKDDAKHPTDKKISFSDYVKNDDLRREHLRRAKINKAHGNI